MGENDVVNFLTFSPAKHRKGAVAFRRKLRSVGEETTQRTACGHKVKGGPTWQGGWERFALHRLSSEHWKIRHISLSGKNLSYSLNAPFSPGSQLTGGPWLNELHFTALLAWKSPPSLASLSHRPRDKLTPSSVPGKTTTCPFWALDKWHLERADWWEQSKNKESSECSQI